MNRASLYKYQSKLNLQLQRIIMGVCVTNFSHVHLCILWNHQNLWWFIFFGWFYRSALTMNLHLNSLTIKVYAQNYILWKIDNPQKMPFPPQILMIPMFLFQCLSDHYIPNTCLTPQLWKRVVIMTKALCIVLLDFQIPTLFTTSCNGWNWTVWVPFDSKTTCISSCISALSFWNFNSKQIHTIVHKLSAKTWVLFLWVQHSLLLR